MPTEAELKALLREHFEAEAQRDVDWVMRTVAEDCEYNVIGPHYPDDPKRSSGKTADGREAVGNLWRTYYQKFSSYEIDCSEDDMWAFPEEGLVVARVRITATPAEDFQGFPSGKPFKYQTGALCWFDENGAMTREMVFGSLGQVLMDLGRMREFLDESAGKERKAS